MIALLAAAHAAPVVLDRVDLLSEPGAPWLAYEAPRLGHAPGVVTARWLEQVSAVFGAGPARLSLAVGAQTVGLESPTWPVSVAGGVVTRVGLPVGLHAGLAVRPGGRVRIGLSAVALSGATWVRPRWDGWTVLPGLGLGVGRDARPKAPWMR